MSDSITWRRFCRIPLEGSVPHPTTLMKLTTRCGSTPVDGLNQALLAKATGAKLLRTSRLRADTTVVASNVSYPTDSGLLAKAVGRMAATQKRIEPRAGRLGPGCGTGPGRRAAVRTRSSPRLRSRSAAGRDEALAAVRRTTGELADLAETAANDAERGLANAKRALRRARAKAAQEKSDGTPDAVAGRRRGRLARAVDDVSELVDATRQIAAQTRQRLSGQTPDGATRRVSLHDPDAGPIGKGRLGKPVEFGHQASTRSVLVAVAPARELLPRHLSRHGLDGHPHAPHHRHRRADRVHLALQRKPRKLLPVILLHGLFDFLSVWEGGLLGGVVGAGMVLRRWRARGSALARSWPRSPRESTSSSVDLPDIPNCRASHLPLADGQSLHLATVIDCSGRRLVQWGGRRPQAHQCRRGRAQDCRGRPGTARDRWPGRSSTATRGRPRRGHHQAIGQLP
jgi:IS5 family transposase